MLSLLIIFAEIIIDTDNGFDTETTDRLTP